jgi:Spy/CpxP family protein refolding chaperone
MENTKTRREAALLVVLVFLLGAALGGVATHVWTSHASPPQPPHGPDQIIARLSHDLDLTADQLKVVTGIVDETHTQVRALYAPLDPQRDQIRQQARVRIRAVLTPEQTVKFETFLRELDAARKKEDRR